MVVEDIVVLLVLVLVIATAVVVVPQLLPARAPRPVGTPSWHAAHHSEGEGTLVCVELRQPLADGTVTVVETRAVGRVDNLAEDYDDEMNRLLQTAKERAFLLELRGGHSGA